MKIDGLHGGINTMLLEEGIELKELLKGASMEVPSFVKVAIAMTKLVQTAHYRKVIIGNLNPTGVQIQPDMNLAVLVENRDPDYAYLAPEQTGRINREPDERSDLYALGMIFYEMLAGKLPFQAHSAEEWVHAHLAIVPSPLRELHPEMPGTLEDMIMKLLSKSPDDRYQSAYGLLADLKQCASSLQERGEIILFEIARTDQASQFRLPHKLFGREAEEAKLREALVRARIGAAEFVLVTGRAGSGKTALIRELQLPIIREGGQFIAGKCDQMIRDIPFEPILQALRRLIRQVSSESPERVAKLKARLAEALDHGAGVIAEFLPEAANLLGDYPVVEPLAPAQAAIRLRRLIPIFIKIFAHSEHALVMFLDDLQWADPATLDVLRTLAHDSTLHGLLFIGAYRIETTFSYTESGETQAAALWIENAFDFQQSEGSLRVQHIALDPLFYVDVRHFVSFIFNENTTRIRLLAELLYHQTGGNPLHLHRLLDSLYREKRIYYDEERAHWTWDKCPRIQMSFF
jgi:energy-coupling factor transporter ATP-binding protein EcfA2